MQELLGSFDRAQFLTAKGPPDLRLPGALDLFSGKAGVARAMVGYGAPWVLTFEVERCPSEVREKLLKLLASGAFESVGAAFVCASFSRAVRPAVRTANPRGICRMSPAMFRKVSIGNSQNEFVRELRDCCIKFQVKYWIEKPDTSFFWGLESWEDELPAHSDKTFRFDMCRFGTRWRKRTRIATNLSLAGGRLLCKRKGKHLKLAGYSHAHRCAWTHVAQAYPAGLLRVIALSACSAVGWCQAKPRDPRGCAKFGNCCRVGKAKNHGPRHPTVQPVLLLPTSKQPPCRARPP